MGHQQHDFVRIKAGSWIPGRFVCCMVIKIHHMFTFCNLRQNLTVHQTARKKRYVNRYLELIAKQPFRHYWKNNGRTSVYRGVGVLQIKPLI